MHPDYSYILTTAGWGLPMATGTNPNRVQKGNRGTKQNPLSSSSDFVLCELNTFEEPLSKEWMGTTAMMTFTLRLSTNPMKKTRAPSSAPGLLVRTRVYIYLSVCAPSRAIPREQPQQRRRPSVVVVQDFYYNATPKAPPKREYGEAIRPGKLPAVATAKLFWVGRVDRLGRNLIRDTNYFTLYLRKFCLIIKPGASSAGSL